ncbi:MAG: chorismate-binding protein, partial [Bacteroidota bacterium]
MDFDTFQSLIQSHRQRGATRLVLPVYRRLSADLLTPVSAFLALRAPGAYPFLLESVEGGEKLARYSFLGRDPYRIVRATGPAVSVETRHRPTHEEAPPEGDIFAVLQHYVDAYEEIRIPGLPDLVAGAVGYVGYDTVRLVEHLPDVPPDDLGLPDAAWCFYDTIVAFDHVKHQMVLMASVFVDPGTDLVAAYNAARDRLHALEATLRQPLTALPAPVRLSAEALSSNIAQPDFEHAVETAKRYIYEGDIFQVVLSQRFAMHFEGDRFNLYRALRQVNPSPYLFFVDFEAYALVGSSPEVLVRVEEDVAEVLPIAGTRRRGLTPEEDESLEADLLADPKERAEHLMLVDLGRNDLGRVCAFGTVEVD